MTTPLRSRRMLPALLLVLVVSLIATSGLPAMARPTYSGPSVRLIVREADGQEAAAVRSVRSVGGRIGARLGLIRSFVAQVPVSALGRLAVSPGIAGLSKDRAVHMSSAGWNPVSDPGSAYNVNRIVKATDAWRQGSTGQGVDVAVIDTGVVPVNGLTAPGAVANGPDLSLEAPDANVRYMDSYGHGTVMSGIIAGRDDAIANGPYTGSSTYSGVAPGSRVISVKVANANGATDVSQIIAAIDWVVANKAANGLNIRVLNLSFGTDGIQDYRIDPLADAAEMAWRRGIVVVVSAGNTGFGDEQLNDPAYDPYVIAVGADDPKNTSTPADDSIPAWSTRGNANRHPDLVAPGKSIVGLRDPGSHLDQTFPTARVADRFFRGSGTSQAAAVVSGAAALLISQRPLLTPDQVKKILMDSATPLPNADAMAQGEGLLNVKAAFSTLTPLYVQTWPISDGSGSLEASRGSMHVSDGDAVLSGEVDIFGQPFNSTEWAAMSWAGSVWSGGLWNGQTWSGTCWCAQTWSGQTWSSAPWSAQTWSGQTWSGQTWSGQTWSGQTWSGQTWSGQTWSGQTWSGQTWSGQTWSSAGWGDE